ncbi:DNA/RNA nuclease SfsA [Shewanella fidelis]|uniref:Sugar fermentation stimulation protein homolog n=1 Tax=Shewanella fidelis TaxID=173509 RepID=A0AAW8NSD3_9GAMM|nr:DNA/RNA nuclease SfsA [Shewanella fidelis]MDR8525131.1 DNA/RNA nuclease SfsA [Shewanella fidelis]MDW4811202.1 DNA/RNA nuclease SfsA [Shewanella fidelis]MDW4815019.1 DNA/RNA nuclease SfsA [Shewanella fidelis]MDW4819109.1 DNA/RNA nuclease SfsA [Shewanella fidelis]MDW4823213.1 DNA/RNA nuclease SfsA [Shewanella fidelis]
MKFDPSFDSGVLIKRYKRFLTDIRLENGDTVTIHCPNTGSMRNCLFEGEKVWFSVSDNPKRKYSRTWELAQTAAGHIIGINTGRANALAEEAINNGVISELQGYQSLRREVKYGSENSRIDILLEDSDKPNCYIEVKSCTLLEQDQGYFPDAVTTRGQKHLRELMEMVEQGYRAVLLFVVQHTGIKSVKAAAHIDEDYAKLLVEAHKKGVEIIAYSAELSPLEASLVKSCPVRL